MGIPTLSIITINLNNISGLHKTIESVLNQTYTNYEYIIIDGGSTDDSVSVISEYADKISYWSSEPDSGIYNAMNKGIAHSKGSYLQFLNSGDYFTSHTILDEIFAKQTVADIIFSEGLVISQDSLMNRIYLPETLNILHLIDYSLFHPGTFISRKTFKKVGLYNESYKIVSDTDFFIRALISGVRFNKVDIVSVIMEPYGISKTNMKLLTEETHRMIRQNLGEQYFNLYLDRAKKSDMLNFLEKSWLIRFLLKHRGNYLINRLVRII